MTVHDFFQTFGPFLGAFFSGLVGVAFGHFLAKEKFRFETLHKERADKLKKLYELIIGME